MEKKIISSKKVYTPKGPYSQGIVHNGLLYTGTYVGYAPDTGALVEGGFIPQAEQLFKNLSELAIAAGSSLDNTLQVTLLLSEEFTSTPNSYAVLNEVYTKYFKEPFPARSLYFLPKIPFGLLIQGEAIIAV